MVMTNLLTDLHFSFAYVFASEIKLDFPCYHPTSFSLLPPFLAVTSYIKFSSYLGPTWPLWGCCLLCVCLGRGCRHVRDKQLQQRGQGGYQLRFRGESGCSLGG